MSEESRGPWEVRLSQNDHLEEGSICVPVLLSSESVPFPLRQSSPGGFGMITSYLLIQRVADPKLGRYCLLHEGFRDLPRQLCASSFQSQTLI